MRGPVPFGKYYLLDRINIGGMAEVFKAKAFGVEGFERLVAVKKILPSIAEDEEFINMFIDEAKICVQLNHANIAQIFDLGKVGDSYFIAMEYVSGRDCRAIYNRARKIGRNIPVEIACYMILRICEGLDYAHNKKDSFGRELNIVHRDISPQNVLVSYEGEVKIIDFGIAKAANKASRTQAGILKGKFGYMSPEQVRGLPFDKRSDIFSVGIVLYELLTSERLFLGETDFSTLEKVRNVDIIPPRHHNPLISPELERIVLKSLARNPDDRYQTAMELHSELQHYLFTSGTLGTRKELTEYMKATFAKEIERERQKAEEYRKALQNKKPVGALPPPPPADAMGLGASDGYVDSLAAEDGHSGGGRVAAPQGLRRSPNSQVLKPAAVNKPDLAWDEDEIETQVFDKEVNELPSKSRIFKIPAGSVTQPPPNNDKSQSGMLPLALPVESMLEPLPQRVTRSRPYLILLVVTLISLVGAGTYITMHIVSQKKTPPVETPKPKKPALSVRILPGVPSQKPFPVKVEIDGKVVHEGATNQKAFVLELDEGMHDILVTAKGHEPYRQRYKAEANTKGVLETRLKLIPPKIDEPKTGRVIFSRLPKTATLFVDGKQQQITDAPLELKEGQHEIRIVPADKRYTEFSTRISVKSGAILPPVAVEFKLKAVQLTFAVTPTNADVVLKDPEGKTVFSGPAPTTALTLKPQVAYSLEVSKRTFETFKKTLTFNQPDVKETITLRKERTVTKPRHTKNPKPKKIEKKTVQTPTGPQYGTLSLNSRPAALILINGVRIGNTPLLNRRLKAGSYTITLISLQTKVKKSLRVTIKPNAPSRHFVPLTQ
ncbi:MAG: serine/threonine protein kinase [Myxococcales bacterium]|nr:serine/threonine protein kinase [Myxococcales bacterium]